MKFKQTCRRFGRSVKKKMPTILTVAGCVGVLAVGVLSSFAVEKAKKTYSEAIDNNEKIPLAVLKASKHYIPAIAVGSITIGCIIEAHILDTKEKALLMSAYIGAENYIREYRKENAQRNGDMEDKACDEIAKHELTQTYAYHSLDGPGCSDRKVWWQDPRTGERILRYEREIIDAKFHFNRNFAGRGYANENEYREFLGFDHILEDGYSKGWSVSWLEIPCIDLYPVLSDKSIDGIPTYVLHYEFEPDETFMDEWGGELDVYNG